MAEVIATSPKRNDGGLLVKFGIPLIIYVLFKFILTPPAPMTHTGLEIVGIFLIACWLWIFVGTGWTSVLAISLVAVSGFMPVDEVIKRSFGDWMFSFMMGCMMVNYVLSESGLSRRIAVWFITRKFVKGKPWFIVTMFFIAMLLLGLGMTSSATCVMFCALAKEILTTAGYTREDDFSQMLYCAIAWLTIAGNGMTAIGHGNFITGMGWVAEAFGIEISIWQSAAIGISAGVSWMICLILIMKYIYKMDASKLVNLDIDALRKTVPPMNKKEKIVAICFGFVIFMWVAADLLHPFPVLAPIGSFFGKLGSTIPVLLCVCALCIISVDGKPVMNFNDTCKKIAWQSCMMLAAVRFLGALFSMDKLGIVGWMNNLFAPIVSNFSSTAFVLVCIGVTVFVTNWVSNSIAMVLFKVAAPMMVMMPGISGPALGVCMIMAAHYAFWTPGCTTTTSFVVGTNDVDGSFMFKHGWLPMIAAFIVIYLVGYRVGCLIF